MNTNINPNPNQMITNADKSAGRKYLKLVRKLSAMGGMATLTNKKGDLKKGSINTILFFINPFDLRRSLILLIFLILADAHNRYIMIFIKSFLLLKIMTTPI